MADTLRLPQSSLARRQLNPIIEEDSDDGQTQQTGRGHQTRRADTSHLKIQAWLSPMSDHFPTPRGINYLSAPVLPSSPSASTASDNSPAASSNPWNRTSVATDSTEFDDLYDVTDEEDNGKNLRRRSSVRRSTTQSSAALKQSMRLVIPENRASEEQRSALEEFKKITSPVPLTPSAQLTMSPAQLHFIEKQQAQEVPTSSAPPSLDGSLTSEQLAAMSAPPTPVIGNDEEASAEESWSGVQLQPGAMATLHALSGEEENDDHHHQPEQVLEISQTEMAQPLPRRISEMRQQPLRLVTNFQGPSTAGVAFSPNPDRQSLADLTKLDIPSPGGFFAGLSPRTRSTWHMFNKSETEDAMVPPTSTTAEQFYRCPWNIDSAPPVPERPSSAEDFYRSVSISTAPVEQVVEVNVDDDVSDDMPTARPALQKNDSDETIKAPVSPQAEEDVKEIVGDFATHYAEKQEKESQGNLDRTQMWLMAQRAYLKVFDDNDNKENDEDALTTIEEAPEEEAPEEPKVEPTQAVVPMKKSVRFSEMNSALAQPKRLPSMLVRQESAYYRAFQDYIVRTQQSDVFVHSLARFEALQAQRVSLRESHRNQLLGKYQLSVVPQSAKKRLSTNVARGDDALTDDLDKLRQEKEHEAAVQMALPTWNVAAMKFLNGGRLITAPVTKRLARSSTVAPSKNGTVRERSRILDLGGQSTCDWAWHCAMQYPNAKVYTVTTKTIRQLSNSNIRGPPNHRQVAIERLTRLPFADNHFDFVYARELHSILKFVGENGEDEWESCLKECMRVLKPGGYIEFSLLDSELMNAGPLGLAKSVEFGFSLKTLGYDPSPSKLWLGRLARAGFEDTRRAWMCLPVGSKRNMYKLPTPPTSDSGSIKELPVMGSADNVASVCSIVGGWNWERWLLRCEMEKVSGELRLADTVTAGAAMEEAGKCLDGVAAVMEEGRNCKAAFRMLNGYARKPLAGGNRETIQIALAE